ncbi:hypothetical protein C8R44DRAFT_864360 [Mycena epipterygia]|nr:hypothetical protein C8R44DRAFT_864360 [Mycena epipterygia]
MASDLEKSTRRYFWAVVSPSPHHSVAYLKSTFATSAAANVKCDEYLALVLESNRKPRDGGGPRSMLAYLVQLSQHPLPEIYLPIAPCRMGSREPLVPGFDVPLSADTADSFTAISNADLEEQHTKDRQKRLAFRKADREAAGLADDDDERWTTFSVKSTTAVPIYGQFFSLARIRAHVRFDIESLECVLPASQRFEDEHEVERRPPGWVSNVAQRVFSSPAPRFDPSALTIIYFDVYWTLIDNESNIFTALAPSLARSCRRFDVISPPPPSVFAEMFTWDAAHTYQPSHAAFGRPLTYHDAIGVPRRHCCLVSGSLFRELEPMCRGRIPGIWLHYPARLVGRRVRSHGRCAGNL